jgi:putative transposase
MLAERNDVYARLKDDKDALHSHKYKTEKQYKQEFEFLKEPDAAALQNVNRNLFQAFQNYFKALKDPKLHYKHPRFKARRRAKQAYKTNNVNNNTKIDFKKRKLKLPKIDSWFKYRDDRLFEEPVKSVTVSKTKSGKYFASIRVERESNIKENKIIEENKIASFDMSFAHFLVSEKDHMENPRFYRKNEKKLKKLHRELSRKKKSSRNHNKARVKLARFYDKIGNERTDWQQKLSTELANEYNAIIIEYLNIEGMKKFNKGFAKTVTLDFSWGEFTRMLGYKMKWLGNYVVKVGRFYPSSKLCSTCGYKNRELKLSDREWTCLECGSHHDRDKNAAKNLKREGERILSEERNITIINSTTGGAPGSHASGDRVRLVNKTAVVDEGRIHAL